MAVTTMNTNTNQNVVGLIGQIEQAFHNAISGAFAGARRRAKYRQIVRELSACSDRSLADIGIARFDIHRVAREGSLDV